MGTQNLGDKMDKLNVCGGGLPYPLGEENRLTWALMNLIRISPIIRAAFLDLIRDKTSKRDRYLH